MTTIHRKPPIRAKHYLKKTSNSSAIPSFGIDEVSANEHLLHASNIALSIFDGFFDNKPKLPSLLYSVFEQYGEQFCDIAQYLWGAFAIPSFSKTMEEILEIFENLADNQDTVENYEQKKQVLQQVMQALYVEIEYREAIQNKTLTSNLMASAE